MSGVPDWIISRGAATMRAPRRAWMLGVFSLKPGRGAVSGAAVTGTAANQARPKVQLQRMGTVRPPQARKKTLYQANDDSKQYFIGRHFLYVTSRSTHKKTYLTTKPPR